MTYVKNAWYVAAWAASVGSEPVSARILGNPLVMWRPAPDQLRVFEDRCVHRHAPLSLGRCEGATLRCMYHGILYNDEGRAVQIPGQDLIPPAAKVRSYPAVERHSWVWVWMGDERLADPNLIPPAVGLDDADYVLGHGSLDYEAEAFLINDNLLDFSHLSFVHAGSFGASQVWADLLPKVTKLERGVRFERWIRDETGTPGMASPGPVERYSRYEFYVPGILLMTGGSFPVGTKDKVQGGAPNLDEAIAGRNFTSQAVTPTGERTARYFFSWGPHRTYGNEETRDTMMGIAGRAFEEDRVMIEAQQKIISADPNVRVMPTAADRGLTIFHGIVDRLCRAESTNEKDNTTDEATARAQQPASVSA